MKTQPSFMSVVVITYNGASTIARTIESLIAQNYPKSRYEIIVVDDGSIDETPEIIQSFPVRYYRQSNSGISSARNAGIKLARGDIYVCMDDDTVASPDYLRKIARVYRDRKRLAGVGGSFADHGVRKGLVKAYILATGRGIAPVAQPKAKRSPFGRFVSYISGWLARPSDQVLEMVEVEELYGANGSFPIEILKQVGGWDPEMSGIEDRDLSYRIHLALPDHRLVSVPSAKIVHDPDLSLWEYLLRGWRRGLVNLRLYRRMSVFPPIFPYPLITMALALAMGVMDLALTPVVIMVLPQLLYFWWPVNAYSEGRPSYLVFPYLQLIEETLVVFGLLRGYVELIISHERRVQLLPRVTLVTLPLVWTLAMTLPLTTVWRAVISLPFLLIIPGYNLLRSIAGYSVRRITPEFISYSVGLSLIYLMVLGFAVNEVGLLFHFDQPLTLIPLCLSIGITSSITGFLAAIKRPAFLLSLNRLRIVGLGIIGLLLPALAVGGAITLNNGGSNLLALSALIASAAALVVVSWRRRGDHWSYLLVLYIVGLTILFGSSMRGWNITGHDVMQEFQVFQLTAQRSVWHMHYYQDAYNACLSITILPTVLQRLTGIPDQYIYKFVVQLYFALLAPILYLSLRRYVSPVMAFLSGVVFVSFPAYLTDMAMLNRQETALIFLALAVLAALDTTLSRRVKSALGFMFLSGMVLSHYSTSYIAVAILLISSLTMFGLKTATRYIKGENAARSLGRPLFPATVVAATVLVLIGWNTLATQTSSNVSATIVGIVTDIPRILATGNTPKPKLTSADSLKLYQSRTTSDRPVTGLVYYSTTKQTELTQKTEPISKITPLGQSIRLSSAVAYRVFDGIKQGYAKLIQALILLGIGLMICSRKSRQKLSTGYIIVGVASVVMVGLQVLLPSSLVNYGLLRLIQQSLIFLAFPVVAASYWILARLRLPERSMHKVVIVSLCTFFLVLSGVLPGITGGYKASLPVSNSGFYYEAYYTHQEQITADQWLLRSVPTGSKVYADEFSRRQMITYSGIFATPTLVPGAIPVDSYVYLSNTNTTLNTVPVYYNGDLLFYATPTTFLESNKDLIYSTGTVKVYR